jgi:hypothetical protein
VLQKDENYDKKKSSLQLQMNLLYALCSLPYAALGEKDAREIRHSDS